MAKKRQLAPPDPGPRVYVEGETLMLRATVLNARDRGNIALDIGGKVVHVPQGALDKAG